MTPIDTILLFGPETPALYSPVGRRVHVLYAGLTCSPCVSAVNHRFSPCQDNLCMQAISVEQVYQKVIATLAQRQVVPALALTVADHIRAIKPLGISSPGRR